MNQYCVKGLASFPPLERATKEGLLAMGGDLSPERLLCAYSLGIFPWFEQDQPILWWSPDPRCVLYPNKFKTSRSLKKVIRQTPFTLSFDLAFVEVIKACAAPRDAVGGTWITPQMHQAYCQLHELGHAHSVEVWDAGELVGGLYGVALGRVFYGESMFSRVDNASKMALKYLCESLAVKGYHLVDCQVSSAHLISLGAETIPRTKFIKQMNLALNTHQTPCKWTAL